jgi:hypothetical protein
MHLIENETNRDAAAFVIGSTVLKIGRAPIGEERPQEQQSPDQGRDQQRPAEHNPMKEWRSG